MTKLEREVIDAAIEYMRAAEEFHAENVSPRPTDLIDAMAREALIADVAVIARNAGIRLTMAVRELTMAEK